MRIDDRQDHCVIHGVDCASGEDCPECGKVAVLEAEAEEDFQAKLRYAQTIFLAARRSIDLRSQR